MSQKDMHRSADQNTTEPARANRSLTSGTQNRGGSSSDPGAQGKLPQKSSIARTPWIVGGGIGLVMLVLVLLPMVVDPYTLSLLYTMFIYLALAQSWNLVG